MCSVNRIVIRVVAMRIHYTILACIIITATTASNAFARGGAGGAFASILEGVFFFAIVCGLIAGSSNMFFLRSTPWQVLIFLFAGLIVIAFMFPVVGILFCLPAFVFLAVFGSLSYMVRNCLIQASSSVTPSTTDEKTHELQAAGNPNVFCWIAGTYLFWAVLSLANLELLSFLAIPPAVFFFPETIRKFLPFILPPLAVALNAGAIITRFAVKKFRVKQFVIPFLFNTCVLLTFLVSAEIYRYHLMSQSLRNHNSRHLEVSSFLKSVLAYRTYYRGSHASFDENSKTYYWSYSERKFFQAP